MFLEAKVQKDSSTWSCALRSILGCLIGWRFLIFCHLWPSPSVLCFPPSSLSRCRAVNKPSHPSVPFDVSFLQFLLFFAFLPHTTIWILWSSHCWITWISPSFTIFPRLWDSSISVLHANVLLHLVSLWFVIFPFILWDTIISPKASGPEVISSSSLQYLIHLPPSCLALPSSFLVIPIIVWLLQNAFWTYHPS